MDWSYRLPSTRATSSPIFGWSFLWKRKTKIYSNERIRFILFTLSMVFDFLPINFPVVVILVDLSKRNIEGRIQINEIFFLLSHLLVLNKQPACLCTKIFKNMNQINEIQTRIIDHRYRLDQVNYNFVPNHLPKIIDLDFPLPKQKIKNKHSYSIRHSYPHLVCFFNKCSTLRVQLCIQSSRT